MATAADLAWMARARGLARRGLGTTAPNPIVGAVVVADGDVVVGQGAHRVAGGPHAEVIALEAAGARARGATLYCTLEPCSHTGRTGPCAVRVAEVAGRIVGFAAANARAIRFYERNGFRADGTETVDPRLSDLRELRMVR